MPHFKHGQKTRIVNTARGGAVRMDTSSEGMANMQSFERYSAQDIGTIAAACAQDYATFKRAALVCMLSARRPFAIVGDVVRDVEINGADRSRWPSAAQKRGVAWLESGQGKALWVLLTANDAVRRDAKVALALATQCPALGLAKGGFLCQMVGIDVGCLDTHNIDKYELPRDALRLRKEGAAATKARAINAYVALCDRLGGSAFLWGAWCEYVADLYPDVYASGRDVSARHVAYVNGIPF